MHSLSVMESHSEGALPASGPKLMAAIEQATSHLNTLASRNGFDKDGWPNHARLWRVLLAQSKELGTSGVAPNILKGDLASPLGIKLDERRWKSFEKWYERHIGANLRHLAERSKIPALKAVRKSNRKGGYPEASEAIFFLAFCEAEKTAPITVTGQIASVNYRGKVTRFFSQIGFSGKTLVFSSVEERWRYGLSIMLFSIFLLLLCFFFPADANRWLFVVASIVYFVIGIFDIDGAQRGKIR